MRIQDDPKRRCWKIEEWPSTDQAAWANAHASNDLLTDDGFALRWRPATRHKNRKGYGYWLHWLDQRGCLDHDAAPGSRVTREHVRSYIAELQADRAPYTVRNRIAELFATLRAMTPAEELEWLRHVLQCLDARVSPKRNKNPMLRPAHELFDWAMRAMRALESRESIGKRAAVAHRDALMIALLASRPFRRGNLAAIEIDRHLVPVGEEFRILFQGCETKNGQILEQIVPDNLAPHLRQHIGRFRPQLIGDTATNRLWVSWAGEPMSGMHVYHRVTQVTARAFGVRISPHLFRDCAATSTAIEAPENVGLIQSLLGHSSPRHGEKHYNQAASLETGRSYQAVVVRLRRHMKRRRKQIQGHSKSF